MLLSIVALIGGLHLTKLTPPAITGVSEPIVPSCALTPDGHKMAVQVAGSTHATSRRGGLYATLTSTIHWQKIAGGLASDRVLGFSGDQRALYVGRREGPKERLYRISLDGRSPDVKYPLFEIRHVKASAKLGGVVFLQDGRLWLLREDRRIPKLLPIDRNDSILDYDFSKDGQAWIVARAGEYRVDDGRLEYMEWRKAPSKWKSLSSRMGLFVRSSRSGQSFYFCNSDEFDVARIVKGESGVALLGIQGTPIGELPTGACVVLSHDHKELYLVKSRLWLNGLTEVRIASRTVSQISASRSSPDQRAKIFANFGSNIILILL